MNIRAFVLTHKYHIYNYFQSLHNTSIIISWKKNLEGWTLWNIYIIISSKSSVLDKYHLDRD